MFGKLIGGKVWRDRLVLHDTASARRRRRLGGLTLTGHLIATAGEDTRRIIEDAEIMWFAREDQLRFTVEQLAKAHKRADFIGGNERIDGHFRQTASENVKRNYATCFVAREIEADRVAGCYTL